MLSRYAVWGEKQGESESLGLHTEHHPTCHDTGNRGECKGMSLSLTSQPLSRPRHAGGKGPSCPSELPRKDFRSCAGLTAYSMRCTNVAIRCSFDGVRTNALENRKTMFPGMKHNTARTTCRKHHRGQMWPGVVATDRSACRATITFQCSGQLRHTVCAPPLVAA